jgi:hypothetical protein
LERGCGGAKYMERRCPRFSAMLQSNLTALLESGIWKLGTYLHVARVGQAQFASREVVGLGVVTHAGGKPPRLSVNVCGMLP